MKIAFFTYLMLEHGGGVAKYYIEVASGLKKRFRDLDTNIITFGKESLNFILFLYSVYFFGKQDKNRLNKESPDDVKDKLGGVGYYQVRLVNLQRKLQEYDLIYSSNNLLEVVILKYLIGYRNLPPVIFGFHVPSYYVIRKSLQSKLHNILYASFIYNYALKGASKLHVLNSYDEKLYRNKFSPSKVTKIYNPFNFRKFVKKASLFKYQYQWDKRKFNILWLGRLTEQKGIDDLIGLINMINDSSHKNKFIWHIVGDGELRSKIKKLAQKWENVNYHGYIENNYVPSIYKENDLLISTSKWESFPYNLLEAQSFGLPVVSFNIPGVRDIVEAGKNGYLVENNSQFREKIILLLEDKKMNKNYIKAYIEKKFDREKLYQKMHKIFSLI